MIAVVDSSVVIKWFVDEEDAELALDLRRLALVAPDLILAECVNVFWKKVRKGEYAAPDAALAIRSLERAGIALVACHGLAVRTHEISMQLDHPAYDCFYLALCEARGLPLITSDGSLAKAVAEGRTATNASIILLPEWKTRLNVPA